ncbi:MAG: PPC domain-containing protein [Hyphomonadaceae bacterium]|nr:PPC domain-containing protein [Hyphomonadaceae bacterium]
MRGKFLFGAASAALLAALGPSAASAQTADPPADASTTARLTADAAVMGELSPAGDADWYRLSVAPGQRYDIALDAAVPEGQTSGFDTMLLLHDAQGAVLASNDDANDSLNSALSYRPSAAGDVFVEVRGFADDAEGAYTLRVAQSAVAPDDIGNDASTRARLTLGQDATGSIDDDQDVDWFRLSVRTGQIYRIALAGDGDGALGDPMLAIADRDGAELASNDDSEGSLNSYLEYVPTQNGDVFVIARAFGGSTGTYKLRADAAALPPDSAGNSRDTRARLSVGQTLNSGLDYPQDTDWYRVRLAAGQSYRFTAASAEGERNFDPMVVVHNSAGEELAVDDDGGEGLNSYLEFSAPENGDYFVEVRGFDTAATGDYTLGARAGDIPADATSDAILSIDGDYREGMLEPAGDRDWYRINFTEGQAVRLSLTSAEGDDALADPYLVMHGPDGAELAQDDDGGEGLNSRLEFAAPSAGAYYLEVRGFDVETAQGRYVIMLTPGEIGDNPESAESVSANAEPFQSTIGAAGDVDWFALDMIEGRPYRINVEGADGSFDPMVRLIDSAGEEIATDDDGGPGLNAYLSYTSVAGGMYYVAVSGFGDSTGMYGVRVSDTEVPGNSSTDEYLDAAQGDDRVSRIELAGDADAYGVQLESGVTYEISVNGEGDGALRDPYLTVLDMDGQTIANDDDSGPGANARLIFTPEGSQPFFIRASGVGNSTGGYRVSIAPQSTRPQQ